MALRIPVVAVGKKAGKCSKYGKHRIVQSARSISGYILNMQSVQLRVQRRGGQRHFGYMEYYIHSIESYTEHYEHGEHAIQSDFEWIIETVRIRTA